jgi:anti-anti-sigma factor
MSSINYKDVGPDLRRIMISGRLDTAGTSSISERLVELANATKQFVVVDLIEVQFLASIGIGALITSAKAVTARGGKMTLVAAKNSPVMMSLEATGIDALIPTFGKVSDAERSMLGWSYLDY